MKKSKKLTFAERQQLYMLQDRGYKIQEIADLMGRHPSTVSRELSRNKPPMFWQMDCWSRARYAHEEALKRRRKPRNRMRLKNVFIRDYVVEKLKLGWTPELIAGRLPVDHPEQSISHEAIYQWIYKEERELIRYLPVAGKRGKAPRARRKRKRAPLPSTPKRTIGERPSVVEERLRFGDWEADSLISRQSLPCVYNIQERKSRKISLFKLSGCTSEEAFNAALTRFHDLPHTIKHTMTLDNGSENFFHDREKRLELEIFFCTAYSAWQRGSVERANQLIRRYFPKKTDFRSVSRQRLKEIEDLINNRPMKCLSFRTPNEVFEQALQKLAA